MKGVNKKFFLLCLILHCSVTEGSSSEEPSGVFAEPSLRTSLQRDVDRKKVVIKKKILPLQADPVILDKNVVCTTPNNDAKERNKKLSCCTGRKVKDRTGVRHRLLHLEYPLKGDTK